VTRASRFLTGFGDSFRHARCLDPGLTRPQDYHLTFRAWLGKDLRQPLFHPDGEPKPQTAPDVWYVIPGGQNLDAVVDDAAAALRGQGLPFIEHYADPVRAFESLLSDRGKATAFGAPGIMMPGNPHSPMWHQAALAIGHLVLDDPRLRILAAFAAGPRVVTAARTEPNGPRWSMRQH
jgi:hypothetical protein